MLLPAKQSPLRLDATELERFAAAVLVAAGASPVNARIVAEHLVDSDAVGLPSHGVTRLTQYIADIRRGEIDPVATPLVRQDRGALVAIDGGMGFGQVAGQTAVDRAAAAAKANGIAFVTVHRAGHAGRIGAYVEALGTRGLVAIACCSGPRSGHFVAPFGGREGRLATNPIAYAFPTQGLPIVADFATSAAPEGVIRLLGDLGRDAPPGALRDSTGQLTSDPAALYARPPGAIQPIGGELQGYKGTALGILVELLGTLCVGEEPGDPLRTGNNLAVIALTVDSEFPARGDRFADHIRSAAPIEPQRPVMMPGDRELISRSATAKHGIPVDLVVYDALRKSAREFGVRAPPAREGAA